MVISFSMPFLLFPSKILNVINPGIIEEKLINAKPKSPFHQINNHTLAILAVKKLGVNLVNVGVTDFQEKKVT